MGKVAQGVVMRNMPRKFFKAVRGNKVEMCKACERKPERVSKRKRLFEGRLLVNWR